MSNRIKQLRKQNKISQTDLAKKLKMSRQAISLYENNKREPKAETWQTIANYFDVPVPYIMGLDDNFYSPAVFQWINQYIDKKMHDDSHSYLQAGNINVPEIKGIMLEGAKTYKIDIVGDDKLTERLLNHAVALSLGNMNFSNSGNIEFFKEQINRACRSLQKRYKSEPNENMSIDLLRDIFDEADKFKKAVDKLKSKYPD